MRKPHYEFRLPLVLALAAISLVSFTTPKARGDVTNYALFWSASFTQNSVNPPSLLQGYFFTDRVFLANAGDFNTGTLLYPGPGSPVTLSPVSPTLLQFGTSLFGSQAALDAAFPAGSYTTTVTNTATNASHLVNILHTQDAFPGTIAALSPATYSGTQGLQPTQAFTFDFNSFVTGSIASESLVFFTVTNVSTNQIVFSRDFLPATTTSILMPANTLSPNTNYKMLLDFSNRIAGTSGTVGTDQGFDYFTQVNFRTAPVPEPMSIGVLSVAAGILLMTRKRQPKKFDFGEGERNYVGRK